MHWRPQLIKLTSIWHHKYQECDGGLYIDPQAIRNFYQGPTNVKARPEDPDDWVIATTIYFNGGQVIHCMETPTQVARLVHEAFGHKSEPGLREVK